MPDNRVILLFHSVMQYRPRTLDDLVIHKDIGDSLRKLVYLVHTNSAHGRDMVLQA